MTIDHSGLEISDPMVFISTFNIYGPPTSWQALVILPSRTPMTTWPWELMQSGWPLCVVPNTVQMPDLGHENLSHREKDCPYFPIPDPCSQGEVQMETLLSYLMGELKKQDS